ncbi:MAG: MIP/aquaporin family protein [Bacteroidota bacterium]
MTNAPKQHWKVYTMEGLCLGLFMVSASLFSMVLELPNSPVHEAIPNGFVRLIFMGVAMGLTAILIIYSPMGKLSGAHMNPAISLVFLRLGKVKRTDAIFYILAQIIGGTVAVVITSVIFGAAFQDPPINFVITAPGRPGPLVAFAVETMMSFGMMTTVLTMSNHPTLAKYTGVIAGLLVAMFVTLSAPISGFSINPARTLASAIPAMQYPSLWIYLTAPFLGMFAAAEVFTYFNGKAICAKMHHSDSYLCIFNCGYCKHEHAESPAKQNLSI